MKNNPVPPMTGDKEERNNTEGATLNKDEIIDGVKNGDIKLEDMSVQQRQHYRRYAPKWLKLGS